jgi:hypothetical protein
MPNLDPTASSVPKAADMAEWGKAINEALQRYSDKDWNYSRISLILKPISELPFPYVLVVDWVDVRGKEGEKIYKTSMSEVTWGGRHSHELGILEIISLRINRGLSEVTNSEYWHGIQPILRLQKKAELVDKGQTHAFWYQVDEVQGEEFENR